MANTEEYGEAPALEHEYHSMAKVWKIIGSGALALMVVIGAFALMTGAFDSASSQSPASPAYNFATESTATVDGIGDIPVVADDGNAIIGDSTGNPATPPVMPTDLRCGILITWGQYFDCNKDQQWVIDAVNRFAPQLGYDWDDVALAAKLEPKLNAQYIVIDNWPGKTEQQAKDDVRSLVNNDAALEKMPVVTHDCFVNTRGLKSHEMSPFVDCKKQVRVALAPLVFDKDNKLIGRLDASGPLVDCYNLYWVSKQPVVITTPSTPPNTSSTVSTTSTTPSTTTTTPSTSTTTTTTSTTPSTTTTTSTTDTTTTTTTSTTTSETLPSKTPTTNPSKPSGETTHPSPPGTPETTQPTESHPAPPPASTSTDAPVSTSTRTSSAPTTVNTGAPATSSPGTTVTTDPGALPQ